MTYHPFPDEPYRIDPFDTAIDDAQFIDATNNGITFAYRRTPRPEPTDWAEYVRRVPMGYTTLMYTQKLAVAEDGAQIREWTREVDRPHGPADDPWYDRWGVYRVRSSDDRYYEIADPNDADQAKAVLVSASANGRKSVLLYVYATQSWH